MEIANLKQAPFAATLMGSMRGIADHFDLDISTPMLYGLTGHAFVVNVHETVDASSPYVWKKARFYELLEGIGIGHRANYAVKKDTPPDERVRVEGALEKAMDAGSICVLAYLEYQIVAGYDESGFLLLQPWNGMAETEIGALSFGTWEQCLDKAGWAEVDVYDRSGNQRPRAELVHDALRFAVELYRAPGAYQVPGYHLGADGYETWIRGIDAGCGSTHGHWWTAQVWSESRRIAGEFFRELAESSRRGADELTAIGDVYDEVADALTAAGDKQLAAAEQRARLEQAKAAEERAVAAIDAFLGRGIDIV